MSMSKSMSRLSDEQKIRIVKMRIFLYTCYLNSALNYNEEGTGTFILNALKIAL